MHRLLALFALFLSALALPSVGAAQQYPSQNVYKGRTISTERWVEEWDPVSQSWVRVSDDPAEVMAAGQADSVATTHIVNGVVVAETQTALPGQSHSRFALPLARPQAGESIAQYGPFRVLDDSRAALVNSTDQASPAWFEAMLRDYPSLEVLEMIEAPGTRHDIANLKIGRMIRAAGLRTHVPAGGSVRSGAVELFLAGTRRTMEEGASFAVHSWIDNYGREPHDFPEDHPANRLYLDYYTEMGMSREQARGFYAMTNSVPHASALWLGAADMRLWVAEPTSNTATRARVLARLTQALRVSGAANDEVAAAQVAYAGISLLNS